MNAATHGLTAELPVFADEQARVEQKKFEWFPVLKPVGPRQTWAAERMMACMVRIERCEEEERDYRQRRATSAIGDGWVVDRRKAAADLGARLHRRPERVVCQLSLNMYGCEWMLGQWQSLQDALVGAEGVLLKPLGEDDRWLACNLLGLNPVDISEPTLLDLAKADAAESEVVAHQAALVAEEIEYLEELSESLAPRDEQERLSAAAGNGLDATIKNFRRYQATAERRLDQATALLEQYRVEDAKQGRDEMVAELKRRGDKTAWIFAAALDPTRPLPPAAPAPEPAAEPQRQPEPESEPKPEPEAVPAEAVPAPAPAPRPIGGRPIEPESISLAELHRVRDERRERIAKAASRGV